MKTFKALCAVLLLFAFIPLFALIEAWMLLYKIVVSCDLYEAINEWVDVNKKMISDATKDV